ncbi:hypothetical protein HPP92_015793 [Vanilla planifolia]|uniref:UspA domain-containing protein n=1 Tax=Vanilla planifolia TaxID=51239 RepID=A0A835UW49_VANPL|nr:hypothetical protein HPP92_015793 [Vanilla planifolia]
MQQIRNKSDWEIEEIVEETEVSLKIPSKASSEADGDEVYVAVGKSSSSMEALSWALKHVAKPSSTLYLIHVFPEEWFRRIRCLHSKWRHIWIEREIREGNCSRNSSINALLLRGRLCSLRAIWLQKAIVDLIPVLCIKRLILGTTKSNIWLI